MKLSQYLCLYTLRYTDHMHWQLQGYAEWHGTAGQYLLDKESQFYSLAYHPGQPDLTVSADCAHESVLTKGLRSEPGEGGASLSA